MHLVSAEGVTGATQQALFMPMLTRMPKARVKAVVVALAPNCVPGAVLRQNGIPVYDISLSKQRFSFSAFGQLLKTVRTFKPDAIQAWGVTAQIASHWLRSRCHWDVKLVWSSTSTMPLPREAGMVEEQMLKQAARFAKRADRIVYTSEAAAAAHRRAGFPEDGHLVIPLGVDPMRFKPDPAARRKIREQLELPHDAFVIGMMAPFQPENDHATLFKAVGELIKTDPHVHVLLAGHGVQKGNGPLMALVGGGTLGTRTQLLGEWSDVSAFFNACDIACSSALTDTGRMSLVIAMLCGVPCVATAIGAQGEVIGQHGVAVEPGSPAALIRGFSRIMQMPQDKRTFLAQSARKHALANFASIRSLQKYLQLYYDLVGRQLEASSAVPAPKIDATLPAPEPEPREAAPPAKPKKTNRTVAMQDLADPDSLESRDTTPVRAPEKPAEGDVLRLFEASLASQASKSVSPMAERARGVPEDHGDLLSPEVLHIAPSEPVASEPAETKASTDSPTPVAQGPTAAKQSEPQSESSAPTDDQEIDFASTTIVSMKVSLDATGTLEIPPELIFTTTQTPKGPSVRSERDVSKDRSVANAELPADSATVPPLAVDALLSQSAPSASSSEASNPTDEQADEPVLQLDLLGDSPADTKAVS